MDNWEVFRMLEKIEKDIFTIQRYGNEDIREELKIAVLNILEAQSKIYDKYLANEKENSK